MRLRASPASPAIIASAILAWACSVSLADGLPEVLPVRRIQLGHPVEDVDEQLEPGIAADLGHQHVQPTGIATRARLALLSTKRRSTARSSSSVRSDASWQASSSRMMRASKISSRRGVDPVEVEHDGIAHRSDRRLGDDQAAAGAATGARHLLVLHQAHGLAEHGAADLVALEQVGLRPEHLAHRPAQRHDVLDDAIGHLGRPLGVGVGTRTRHRHGRPRASSSAQHYPANPGYSGALTCIFTNKSGPKRSEPLDSPT